MATEKFANSVSTTLSTDITTLGQTTIIVVSATGFPADPQFRILVNGEIMLVTAVSGTTWTVTRGVESTQTTTCAAGTLVEHIFTAGALSKLREELVSIGTYANLPTSSQQTGDLYVPTDSFYDFIRYNGSSWDHFRNGRKLTVPVDASYSWDNAGTGTVVTTYGGVIGFTNPGTSGQLQVRYKTAPATPYTITMACLPHYIQTNSSFVGFAFRDATGKLATAGIGYSSSAWNYRISKWTTTTSFSADYTSGAVPPMVVHGPVTWLQISNTGTNRIYRVSSNGINWTQLHTIDNTDFMNASAAHQVGFCWGDVTGDIGLTVLHWEET